MDHHTSDEWQHRTKKKSSRLPGFYELPIGERIRIAKIFAGLTEEETATLSNFGAITPELVDVFIENAVGTFSLPLGVATNFRINGEDILVPMAVEETSVVAGASHGAKLIRAGGGFKTAVTSPIMTGQIQLFIANDVPYDAILQKHRQALIDYANLGLENLISRGGGVKDLDWHFISEISALVIHIHADTRDAMGANIVNTMCERVSTVIQELIPCDIGLRILTNLTDRRLAQAACCIPASAFTSKEFDGRLVVDRIEKAYKFAFYDYHRATTHNKGVMNGIDSVLIATGNDWRAVEAGAHAYACRDGQYRPMTKWWINNDGDLEGMLELPMAVGTVGGVTKLHPTAQACLRLMNCPSAAKLAEIICAVGLAQNLSALRALASEGIQRGHMNLHQRNLVLLRRRVSQVL